MSIAPSNEHPSVLRARSDALINAMLTKAHASAEAQQCRVSLGQLPLEVLEFVAESGARIHLLQGRKYISASRSLRRLGVNVDAWPVPPAGLWVNEEKTIFLRVSGPMTIHHEFAHAIDCALGSGSYRSGHDTEFRSLFANAKAFVTPYAATGLDEFFAESYRGFHGLGNEASSPWPAATPQRLRTIQPELYQYFDSLMLEIREWAIQANRCVSPRLLSEKSGPALAPAGSRGQQLTFGL